MPEAGIHGRSSTNCIPAAGRKVHHKGTEMANSTRLAARATCFAQRSGTSSTIAAATTGDRKSTRLNSSHANISYAVFCLKKKKVTLQGVSLQQRLQGCRSRLTRLHFAHQVSSRA